MRKYNGAISIFLVIITLASVTLGGVFIDLSRILVAKNRVRTATESAVRSTLASYDEDLNYEWGLFGLSDEDAEETFKKYFKLNLENNNKENKSSLIHYEINNDKTNIQLELPLSDSNVFSSKITEYSKYRAPVSLTLGVIDKFKAAFRNSNVVASIDITSAIDDLSDKKSNTFDNIKNIPTNFQSQVVGVDANSTSDGKMGKIDINNVNTMGTNIATSIDDSKAKLNEYGNSLNDYSNASELGNQQAQNVINSVNTSEAKSEISDNNTIGNQNINTYQNKPQTSDNMDSIISQEESRLNNTKDQVTKSNSKADELKVEMQQKVESAKQLASEYNILSGEYNQYFGNIQGLVASVNTEPGFGTVTANDVLNFVDKNNPDKSINEAAKYVNDINKKITDLESVVGSIANANDNYMKESEKAIAMQNEYNAFNSFYIGANRSDNELIAELNRKSINNQEIYPNMLDYYENFLNDRNIAAKDFINFYKSFPNEIEKVSNLAQEYNKKANKAREDQNNLAKLIAEKKEVKYRKCYIIANNQKIIKEAVEKKVAADNKYAEYQNKLTEIKGINTYDKIGGNDIQDFAGETYKSLEGSENVSGDNKKEEPNFSMSKLFDLKNQAETLINDMGKVMPVSSGSSSDLVDEEEIGVIKLYNQLKDYFNGIGELISNPNKILDKIYLVDYVMSKCSYVTSQTPRNHYFNHGEVEYIIFGKSKQSENIAIAVGCIAFMRFAINAINYWITTPGGLITRTVTALTRGLTQTIIDMTDMVLDTGNNNEKGLIAICPSLSNYKVLSYSDHLRLLMLLKISGNGGTDALKRCISATLESNGSDVLPPDFNDRANLGNYYTKVKATSSVDVDLFFIPLLLPDFVNIGGIHDGKYEVNSTFSFGY